MRGTRVPTNQQIPKSLVVDAMSAHRPKAVRAHCNKRNVKLILISNGLTAYLQAADVLLFKPYKAHLSSIINEWKLSGKVTFTKDGNPRKPDDDTVIEWVYQSLSLITEDQVKKAALICGIEDDY